MSRLVQSYNFRLEQFDELHKAVIDASSIIYANKSGFFNELICSLSLYTIPEIIKETGFEIPGITIFSSSKNFISNDDSLVHCAVEKKLAIISEDRKILKQALKNKLPYYNALMMLNFIFYKKKIDRNAYDSYYQSLTAFAHYDFRVLEYGKMVLYDILMSSG